MNTGNISKFNAYFNMQATFSKTTLKAEKTAVKNGETEKTQDLLSQFGKDADVELSGEGLNALAAQKTDNTEETAEEALGNIAAEEEENIPDEEKLSDRAKEFLKNLREKYGDYDFFATEKIGDTQELTKNSTKAYSVILTNDEIEKMAADEEYADEVMGKVGSAVDTVKRLEANEELGEGVKFTHISISFDDQGNTKLFAQLEKMTAEQQERAEEAKEKRAEEAKEEKAEEEKTKNQLVKRFSVEATSEEELLQKILGIDWDSIGAEEEENNPFAVAVNKTDE